MEKSKSLDDNYFIKNAIYCWLHHYGDQGHRWDDIYKELAKRDTYIAWSLMMQSPSHVQHRRRKPKVSNRLIFHTHHCVSTRSPCQVARLMYILAANSEEAAWDALELSMDGQCKLTNVRRTDEW